MTMEELFQKDWDYQYAFMRGFTFWLLNKGFAKETQSPVRDDIVIYFNELNDCIYCGRVEDIKDDGELIIESVAKDPPAKLISHRLMDYPKEYGDATHRRFYKRIEGNKSIEYLQMYLDELKSSTIN